MIYYRGGVSPGKPTGTKWFRVPGRLAQIDVHGSAVYGRNRAQHIYTSPLGRAGKAKQGGAVKKISYTGTWKILAKWRRLPGALIVCSTGGAGVWGVNRGHNIYRWIGRGWRHIRGKLAHIAVGGTQVWGVNKHHNIYMYLGGHKWKHIGGKLTNVSCTFTNLPNYQELLRSNYALFFLFSSI